MGDVPGASVAADRSAAAAYSLEAVAVKRNSSDGIMNGVGVRPSPGAASYDGRGRLQQSRSGLRMNIAAPGDGRTPTLQLSMAQPKAVLPWAYFEDEDEDEDC